MNFPFFVARRYLVSTRKKNFINVISLLAVAGIALSTAALVIVLSVFNGLEDLLRSLNNSFDPAIKIEAAAGKSFTVSDSLTTAIKNTPGVAIVTEVIEDYAYVRYRDANQIVMLKGVSDNFIDQQRIPQDNLVLGKMRLKQGNVNYAIVGQGVSSTLSLVIDDPTFAMQVYYIKNAKTSTTDPSSLYSQKNILPGGVFSILSTIDEQYVLVPLAFAQELLDYGDKRTSLEIKLTEEADAKAVQQNLQQLLGTTYLVLTQEEQHKDLYRLLKMEKLFTFLTFTLLLGIASINVFFSLMMLALDKKKDISILSAMGAPRQLIRNIFLSEGAMIAFAGGLLGLVLGGIICWLQQTFGFVSMGMETSVTPGYPIKMVWTDFALTASTIIAITILVSFKPAASASAFASVEHL